MRMVATVSKAKSGVSVGSVPAVTGLIPWRANRPAVYLDLRIDLRPHALFELDADGSLHCAVPVDGYAWIDGRTIDVPTLSGLHRLQITRGRLLYRLAGQGFPTTRQGPRADMLIRLQPAFPERPIVAQDALCDGFIDHYSSEAALSHWQEALRVWQEGLPS